MLQMMGMIVPLGHYEATQCSKTDTFRYIPVHEREHGDTVSLLDDDTQSCGKALTDECKVYDISFDANDITFPEVSINYYR